MRILTLICFPAAALVLQAAHSEDKKVTTEFLSLEAAIGQALANNLQLIAQRYAPADAQDDIASQEAAFDVSLFGSAALSERRAAATNSALDSASIPESETRRTRVGVNKRLSSGASVTVDTDLTRRASNNNAVRNPDYESNVGVSIQQPLYKGAWARTNLAPLARAKVTAEQTLFRLRSNILDVIAETEIAYWNLAFARAVGALNASSLELAETLLKETSERERLGLITRIDVLQAETELITQQEDSIQAERTIEDAKDELRRLMSNQSFLDPLKEDIFVSPLPQQIQPLRDLSAIVADTIRSDAEAAVQERTIEVARINAMLAKDQTRIDLNLIADLSYSGRDDNAGAYPQAYNADGYAWTAGLELSLPWGFRDARAGARKAERAIEREAIQLYDIKQQKAFAARNAWRAVNTGLKRIEVTEKSVRLNEESFEEVRARYGSGLVAYRQVLEAQRDLDAAQENHLRAVIETIRANVRLGRIDGSILTRNNYDWSIADGLAEEPIVESHPLSDEIIKPGS